MPRTKMIPDGEIIEFVRIQLKDGAKPLTSEIVRQYGVSRQSAFKYVRDLASRRIIIASGRTKGATYDLVELDGTPAFARTVIPVKMAAFAGETIVSRSQAKRLTARCEKFIDVFLDFSGVAEIGQGFADEVFRVFADAHPEINIQIANASPDVLKMIQRARAASDKRS